MVSVGLNWQMVHKYEHLTTSALLAYGFSWVELADGSQIRAPYYIGSVSVIGLGCHSPCHICLIGNKELVGLELLESLNIVPDILQSLRSKGIVAEWTVDP